MVSKGYMPKSKTDSWQTPPWLRVLLSKRFDCGKWDPCPLGGQEDVHVENGLKIAWPRDLGAIYVNPPYSRLATTKKHGIGWVEKAYKESLCGRPIVMLLPARTDTKWFHDIIIPNADIYLLKGRIKFGQAKTSAPFPCMVSVFRICKKGTTHGIYALNITKKI